MAAWIVALDSDSFQQREQATKKLTEAGAAAVGPLRDDGLKKAVGPERAWRTVAILKTMCIDGNEALANKAAAALETLAEKGRGSLVPDAKEALTVWKKLRSDRAVQKIAKLGGHIFSYTSADVRGRIDENWKGGDDGLKLLRDVVNLSDLDVRSSKLTDKALLHLADLESLKTVRLYNAAYTADGVERLKKASSDLAVYRFGSAVLGIVGEEDPGGCRVKGVATGLGAEQGGIQEGDVITQIDDEKVDGFQRLTLVLAGKKVGDKVRVELIRGEKKITAHVLLKPRSQIEAPRIIRPAPFRIPPPR